jgi:hypothetical protein
MDNADHTHQTSLRFWLRHSLTFRVLGVLALIALFYAEENWRGKRAWQKCKQDLESRGAVLDWSAFIPPLVPVDDNVLLAPRMELWFVGRGPNSLSASLALQKLSQFAAGQKRGILAQVHIATPGSAVPGDADFHLRYDPPFLVPADQPTRDVIPLVVLDSVPLSDAFKSLGKSCGLKITIDQALLHQWKGSGGASSTEPRVSLRLEKVTPEQTLNTVLTNYGLILTPATTPGYASVTPSKPGAPYAYVEPSLAKQLAAAIARVTDAQSSQPGQRKLEGPQGITLLASPSASVKPLEITIIAADLPTTSEIESCFAANNRNPSGTSGVGALRTGSNTFTLYPKSFPAYAAADYIAWTDQAEEDFDFIRAALKRPFAQIPGDYSDPVAMPIPNFVAIRSVSQVLAQRAQCFLLLDRPAEALRELELMHGLSRVIRGNNYERPVTLVAAMIDVAVTGIYTSVIADGLRLHAWREPELIALQEQLSHIHLLPGILQALRYEQTALPTFLQNPDRKRLSSVVMPGATAQNTATRIFENMRNSGAMFVPRGWIYQNMANVAFLEQRLIEASDPAEDIISPGRIDRILESINRQLRVRRPYSFLVAAVVPNYTKACQTLAKNQTAVHQCLIACGLERFHIAQGNYPPNLQMLVPQHLAVLPREIINGGPYQYHLATNNSFQLYSVGWNEKDDGGTDSKLDWLW